MSNISNLTSKILKDAEERKESILAEAEKEKNSIIEKKRTSAKALEKVMIDKAKMESQTRKDRVISGAILKARNERIEAKQAVIKEVLEKSISELCSLNKEKYIDFIKRSILSLDIEGDEKLILNENGKTFVSDDVLNEINEGLVSKGKKGEIVLCDETRNFKGGFILEKEGIEVNSTFEALVNSLKEELEFQVARELFD